MADPVTGALLLSAAAPAAAVAAPATATLGLGAMGAGAGALGTMGAMAANPLVGALGSGIFAAPSLAALSGNSLLGTVANAAAGQAATILPTQAFPAAMSSSNLAGMGPPAFVGPQAPTMMQSAINTGQNIQGLMSKNPALTSVAKQAAGGMMQPPPPPQVLQAPPIQSGQFAPVDFMSLLSQKPQQMQRRTSLLG